MRRRMGAAAFAIVGILSLAACSGEQPGQAQPVDGASPTGSSSAPSSSGGSNAGLPHSGAPKVREPLDVSAFLRNPCSTLTRDQVINTLRLLPQGERIDEPSGPRCRWSDPSKGSAADLIFYTSIKDGLSNTYQTQHNRDVFEPMEPIQGYPAVIAMTLDGRPSGRCSIEIGLSDQLTAQIGATVSRSKIGKSEPCQAVRMVADLMLTTMKRGE